jgi:hypothetical protein
MKKFIKLTKQELRNNFDWVHPVMFICQYCEKKMTTYIVCTHKGQGYYSYFTQFSKNAQYQIFRLTGDEIYFCSETCINIFLLQHNL